MATFIKSSVGAGGTNNSEDVKVIQWLLNQAEAGYRFMSSLAKDANLPGIVENGIMNASTQLAIDDWSRFCDRIGLPKDKPAIYRGIKIEPGSQYYNRLIFGVVLKATGKSFTNISENYQDPRVKQALDGRITFEQFKVIIKQAKGKMLTDLGREMQKYSEESSVKAFLDVIAWAEGTDSDERDGLRTGYDIRYGGTISSPKYLTDLYNHPGIAAGRYQAVTVTWNEAVKKLGLYDFTVESQEIFGVYALHTKRPGSLDAVRAGKIEDAIEIASQEWASFPNRAASIAAGGDVNTTPTSVLKYASGPKKGQPQPAKPLSKLLEIYNASLGNYQKAK